MDLRKAVSLALTVAAAGVAVADADPSFDERVQVSATRAPGTATVLTGMPLVVITAEQIAASGHSTIGDVLRTRHLSDALGLSNVTTSTRGGSGAETASLRGLGSSRTLVLVNGRRWLALGDGQVDLTQIPIALVQRIEVLGDGASAVYGSDAVAGVVNIVLRRDYDGAEVEMATGMSFKGDGAHRSYGVTIGAGGARSGLALNLRKDEQDPIWAGDRRISRTPVAFVPEAFGSLFGEYGVFFAPELGNVCLDPAVDQQISAPSERLAEHFIPVIDACRYNFAPDSYLLAPSDRLTMNATGFHRLTAGVSAFVEATYNRRSSLAAFAPPALSLGFGGPQSAFPVSAQNLWNPFGIDLLGAALRVPATRSEHTELDTYFITAGFEGTATIAARPLDWEVFFSRGEMSRSMVNEGRVNLLHLERAVGPSHIDPTSGMPVCGTVDAPIASCVPLNLFSGSAGVTQDMLDYVLFTSISSANAGLRAHGGTLTTEVMMLPAGPLAVAVGAEARTNAWSEIPDTMAAAGISDISRTEPTLGEQHVDEWFFELGIPLVADRRGARLLEASVAGRLSRYGYEGMFAGRRVARAFDADAFSFALMWQPFESLVVRAGRNDVFRAPSVVDMFHGGVEGMPSTSDPCSASPAGGAYFNLSPEARARCHAQGVQPGGTSPVSSQVRSLNSGNPNLLPEQGVSQTFGVTYRPHFIRDLEFSADVWRVTLNDAITALGIQDMLNRCIVDGNPQLCPPDDPNFLVERGSDGNLTLVRNAAFNQARVRVSGVDFASSYRFDTAAHGSLHARFNATWTREALVTGAGAMSEVNVAGRALGALGGPTWRWRGNTTLDWYYGDFAVTWTVRFLSSLMEPCTGFERSVFSLGLAERELCSHPVTPWAGNLGHNRVPAMVYNDVSVAWRAPWSAVIRAGARNVFDKGPPFMTTPSTHSFDHAYDLPGPFWFASYRQAL